MTMQETISETAEVKTRRPSRSIDERIAELEAVKQAQLAKTRARAIIARDKAQAKANAAEKKLEEAVAELKAAAAVVAELAREQD